MKRGRKPKWTNETVTKLEQAFSIGASVSEACIHAGISRNTYYRQVKENPELSDRFELLQQKMILRARNTVAKALLTDGKLALKYLALKKPQEFQRVARPREGKVTFKPISYKEAQERLAE